MGVPISNVTRRVVYEADGTGPYSFSFEILANTDIAVYKDDALLTLTTDYTVTINANGTGSIANRRRSDRHCRQPHNSAHDRLRDRW
jgi:hypothetical protein